jgi:hypothetical protein
MILTFTPAASTGVIHFGNAGHADRGAARDRLPDPGRTGRLDVHIIGLQPDARERAEKRIIGRVLIGHNGEGLALQLLRLVDAGIGAHHRLHEPLAAEHGDDFHRHTIAAHDDRAVTHHAAELRIAGADLLCHVDAAASDREIHVEPGIGEIPFPLGDLQRSEGRQQGWRRKQISDAFGGQGRSRRKGEKEGESGDEEQQPRRPRQRNQRLVTLHLILVNLRGQFRGIDDIMHMSGVCPRDPRLNCAPANFV